MLNSIDYFDRIIEIFAILSIRCVIPSITRKKIVTAKIFPGILSPLRLLIEQREAKYLLLRYVM